MERLSTISSVSQLTEGALYRVFWHDQEVPVYHTDVCDYVVVWGDTVHQLRIQCAMPLKQVVLRPRRFQDCVEAVEQQTLHLSLPPYTQLAVEPDGDSIHPLLISCKEWIPCPEDATVIYRSGQVYHIGCQQLHTGDHVYLEPGAVVCGRFFAADGEDISITGLGLLLGSTMQPLDETGARIRQPMICEVDCRRVRIAGISLLDSPGWNIVPTACQQVEISHVTVISLLMCGDGIDVVGCEDVRIQDCLLRTNDDCIAVKAVRYDDERGARRAAGITARRCVLWDAKCGNAIEIGYETSAHEICDILFEDMDVIHCEKEGHQSGGVFTIHNGDRARVHHVTYRNIRVEDAQEKLVDFKILSSKYSSDLWRGQIDTILFEDIAVTGDRLAPSILRGFENELGVVSWVENVRFRHLTFNGLPLCHQLDAHMIVELSRNVEFLS